MENFEYSYKIKSLDEAKNWRNELKNRSKKLVMTNGCFDIIHRGHLTYLINSRKQGDALLLAVNSDSSVKRIKGPGKPVINEKDRTFILSCFAFINAILIFDTPNCDNLLEELKPDVYVKGADYNINTMVQSERRILEKIGTKIRFLSHVEGYSSTNIIKKINN
ncbi:MAG: adenylyltransferase/cytidyltransferase family protein [Victivallales bacterium]|nr:adenylyltransferase/cytidyltransferase family protein [Victivallales bacterium]MCF7889479.1 adenylyltransferase/cytidyltransferase family protein [Victivallales bacterium]